jgi:hypothetical protein
MHHIVPPAQNVANYSHHVMPDAATPAAEPQPDVTASGATALACPFSGAPCPALAAFFPHFEAVAGPDAADIQAFVRSLMPCDQCRVSSAAGRDNLRHLRLGQREREILLAAAAQEALVLTQPGMTRSLSAARRRAALSLGKAGLVAPVGTSSTCGSTGDKPPSKTAPRATIALTPLGRYVMTAYGRFIAGGKPVRWTRPARGAVLPGRDPADLMGETLALTQAALRDTLNELKGVLIAAVGRPLRSPGLLDTVTRHLERKAMLLRAVLEPSRSAAPASPRGARSPA